MKKILVLLLSTLLVLVIAGCKPPGSETSSEPSSEPSASASESSQPAISNEELVRQHMTSLGFTGVKVNQEIDLEAAKKATAGDGRFADAPLFSSADTVSFLTSGSEAANTAKQYVAGKTGAPESEVVDPSRWVAVQTKDGVSWKGNTSFVQGNVQPVGVRHDESGAIIMVFVSSQGRFAYLRAACANPQTEEPKPKCEEGCKPKCKQNCGGGGDTPKDPTKDVNVNPKVPANVKGPGTTPVGKNPGKPTPPIDSSTGCRGSCGGGSTQPPSGGGGSSSAPTPVHPGAPSSEKPAIGPTPSDFD